jgi:pimeloyl-ACP methyl ester carboxylesterase
VDLAVTETGSGDVLVVFVHGVLDRGRSFERVASLLAPECRVLRYDRRGYGASADAPGAPVEVERHVADLLAILDHRQAIVVGHSFGGVTAMGAAVRAPELVDALVLYETGIAWAPGWDDSVMQKMLGADDPETAGLHLMLGDRYDALSGETRARLRREATAFVVEERSVRTGTVPFDVRNIRSPLVYGRGGTVIMRSAVEYLAERVPRIEEAVIPGGDHHAHRRAPEAFAGLVRRGLELARG